MRYGRQTKVVSRHDDAVFVLDRYDGGTGDDRLLSILLRAVVILHK